MNYNITITEEQLRVIQNALEEYFRLRMGQTHDFADDIAFMGKDISRNNQNRDKVFSDAIEKRDFVETHMKEMFRYIWPPYGTPNEKTDDMLISEDIWDAIRCARGIGRYDSPLQLSTEPIPTISKTEE